MAGCTNSERGHLLTVHMALTIAYRQMPISDARDFAALVISCIHYAIGWKLAIRYRLLIIGSNEARTITDEKPDFRVNLANICLVQLYRHLGPNTGSIPD